MDFRIPAGAGFYYEITPEALFVNTDSMLAENSIGIEVDDAMDGVISKVNEVGNSFAVSYADIVEALMRSSSAMFTANNSFEETVLTGEATYKFVNGSTLTRCTGESPETPLDPIRPDELSSLF